MTDHESNDGGVDRRDWLKGTGALGVGAVASAFTGTAAAAMENTITIEALTDRVKYHLEVDGEMEKGRTAGNSDDILDGRVVRGDIWAKGRTDDFRFSGTITGFEVEIGTVAVSVNGEHVDDPVGLPGAKKRALPNVITIQAEESHVDYRFEVTGDVEAGSEADVGEGDAIDGRVVTGNVAGSGVDDYRYSGAVKFTSTDGPLTVTLELDQADG
jgi:hypothetical protein